MVTDSAVVKEKEVFKEHTLLFPYCNVIFGFSKELIMEASFKFHDRGNNQFKIIIDSLVADIDEEYYDYTYLLEDTSSGGLAALIITGITGNKKFWDEKEPWW
jgi:hypothetical protein